ncbi:MAG: hypothetical protein ACM3ML_29550 [Micromonosporaceae bacterium]
MRQTAWRASPTRAPFNKVAGLGFGGVPGAAALVTTQPGSKSQRNVQRRGFDLPYTRSVLVKQP